MSKGADLKNAPPGGEPALSAAQQSRRVSQIEQKLDDLLGPVQSAEQPKPRTPLEIAEGFVPDIVRDSQYYVLEITDYGAKLADILMSIHEPDPEDDSIRQCHRVTAGQMIIDRVLGPASNLQYDLDSTYDPAEDPYWALRHPAEIDSQLTPEELKEADRLTRNFTEGMKKEDDGQCDDCTDDYLCEYHDPKSEYYDDGNVTDEEIAILARSMKNLAANEDRSTLTLPTAASSSAPATTSTTPNPCQLGEPVLSLSKPVLSPVEGPVLSPVEGPVLSPVEGPVLSPVEGPVLSPVEGPVLSPVEGPVLSPVEGPVLSPVEGPVLSPVEGDRRLLTLANWGSLS